MLKRFRHTAVAVALAVAAIPVTIAAQQPAGDPSASHYDYANGCFPFGGAFGAVNHFNVCVSSHGNLAKFDFHNTRVIEFATIAEGYIVCATVSGVARVYHDVMWSEGGWGAATSSTPGALPITVVRTTTDGAFTLTQTYTRNNTEREWNVTMKLRANVPSQVVRLVRTVDIDIDATTSNNFDASIDTVWGSLTHGFTSSAITRTISHYVSYNPFPTACDSAAAGAPVAGADLGATVQWNLGNMNAGNTKSVKLRYAGN